MLTLHLSGQSNFPKSKDVQVLPKKERMIAEQKKHDCGGKAKADNLSDEWVYTPTGVCDKIGGKVLKVEKLKG